MRFGVFLAILTVLFGKVYGQDKEPRERPNQRLELLRVWWLVDELQIDAEQAALVFPVWSEHNSARRDLRMRRKRVEGEAARLLEQEEAPQQSELNEALSDHVRQLRALDAEAAELKRNFHNQMEGLLSLRQHARLLLFEDRFRRDLKGLVRDVRNFRSPRQPPPWQGEGGADANEGRGRERFRGPWW